MLFSVSNLTDSMCVAQERCRKKVSLTQEKIDKRRLSGSCLAFKRLSIHKYTNIHKRYIEYNSVSVENHIWFYRVIAEVSYVMGGNVKSVIIASEITR